MVKPDIVHQETTGFFKVATIVGIEEGSVESGDRFFKLLLVLDLVKLRHALGIAESGKERQSHQNERQLCRKENGFHGNRSLKLQLDTSARPRKLRDR